MQMQLKVLGGSQDGKNISVNQEKFVIGRSDECQLRPKSDSISRRHCAIVQKDGRSLLLDLKSRNGTFVNDKQVDPAKAKILKHGDKIRVGKLEFEVIMEVGIAQAKKPEVKDVKDAAARSAEGGADSRFEEVDVSQWLEEAEQIRRSTPVNEPVTRQFVPSSTTGDSTVMELNASEETKGDGKKGPGKLPTKSGKPTTKNSKDAAQETLRKFFSGR